MIWQKHVLMTALVAVSLSSVAAAADSIQWAANLEEARTMAVQQNKLLLIHFGTPDCQPCKAIERNVFPMASVSQTINQYYVPLKVNAYEDQALVEHFGVKQWPTDVVATVEGTTVQSMVTEQNPDKYIKSLARIAMQNRGMVPSKNKDIVQVASSPSQQPAPKYSASQFGQNAQTAGQPWAKDVGMPELPKSTAQALRPGVGLASGPGSPPLGGPMGTNRFGNVPSQTNRYGNVGVGPKVVEAVAPATVSNRFAAEGSNVPQYAANQPAPQQTEIGNPYAGQQPAPTAIAPPAPPVSSRQPNSVVANNNRFNRFDNSMAAPAQAPLASPPPVAPSFAAPTNQMAQSPTFSQPEPSPQTVAPPTVAAQTAPVGQPDVGLDGRCPVTLITQGKWRKGDAQWGAIHRGHTYLFAGPEQQQEFLKNPDEYSPVLAGMDVVQLINGGRVVQGNRRFGVLYDDDGTGSRPSRIYLFDSVATRNRFEAAPEEFLQPVMQAMQSGQLDTLLR